MFNMIIRLFDKKGCIRRINNLYSNIMEDNLYLRLFKVSKDRLNRF